MGMHMMQIFALSCPHPRNNVITLLKAFGQCQYLQEITNLVKNCISKHFLLIQTENEYNYNIEFELNFFLIWSCFDRHLF